MSLAVVDKEAPSVYHSTVELGFAGLRFLLSIWFPLGKKDGC
jgi:hypothetical protein